MIELKNFNLYFNSTKLLHNISLQLDNTQSLGIIGKSGAGKSLFSRCFIKLLDTNFHFNADVFKIDEFDLLDMKLNLNSLRKYIGFIFQDASSSFYPLLDMGSIFELCLKTHTTLDKKQRKELAFGYFELLGLKNFDKIWHSYIHQLSIGMAMRVQFALVLSIGAKIIICDEITNSLDKKNILNTIEILKILKEEGVRLILISHDMDFIKNLSDEIVVFDEGQMIERNSTTNFFSFPKNPYSKSIIEIYEEYHALKS